MTNTNTDIEELEELLTELEGQEARLVTPYTEEDDAVTTQMEAPTSDQEWMVQVTALDRRMMGTELIVAEWRAGKISDKTLVWRSGMSDWTSLGSVPELRSARDTAAGPPLSPMSQSAFPAPASVVPPAPPVARPSMPLASSPVSSAPAWSAPAAAAPSVPPPPAPAARLAPPPPTARPATITVPVNPAAASAKAAATTMTSATQPSFTPSQTNSMRPVAMDFPQESASRAGGSKKLYIALGAVGIAAICVLGFAMSGGDEKKVATASPEPKPAAAAPQAVMGLNPTPAAEKKEAPAPQPVAKTEDAPAKAADEGSTTETASASMTGARARSANRYVSKGYGASRRDKSESESGEKERPEAEPAETKEAPAATAAAAEPAGDVEDGVVQEEAPEDGKVASGGKRFDKEAAAAVLKDAAEKAKNCRPKGGPTGNGRVRIRYEPSGKVSSVSIVTSKFDNTVAGSCVTMLFRRAQVPAFAGGAVVVNKEFEIP